MPLPEAPRVGLLRLPGLELVLEHRSSLRVTGTVCLAPASHAVSEGPGSQDLLSAWGWQHGLLP